MLRIGDLEVKKSKEVKCIKFKVVIVLRSTSKLEGSGDGIYKNFKNFERVRVRERVRSKDLNRSDQYDKVASFGTAQYPLTNVVGVIGGKESKIEITGL